MKKENNKKSKFQVIVKEDVWEKLMELKIKLRKTSINDVIRELIEKNEK